MAMVASSGSIRTPCLPGATCRPPPDGGSVASGAERERLEVAVGVEAGGTVGCDDRELDELAPVEHHERLVGTARNGRRETPSGQPLDGDRRIGDERAVDV